VGMSVTGTEIATGTGAEITTGVVTERVTGIKISAQDIMHYGC
jgi:hypothetical protein